MGFLTRSSLVLALVAFALPNQAASREIPAFARKYGVSCNLCHNPAPRLTAFGETFAGNGFRMSGAEPMRDTVGTGDELLSLPRSLPLAMRFDAYVQAYANGDAVTDFQTPYGVKILSSGAISNKLSYYLYFFLFERGEVAGIEDAFVYINDIGNQPIDLAVGQFQVSDPLFKRELRLEIQDYAIYRARLGDQPTDLTYDRGFMAVIDAAGFTLTAEAVNGNGKGEAESNRRLDNDRPKNFLGHVTRDITSNVRLGTMGYRGLQTAELDGGGRITNTVWMLGGDATVSVGPLELNAQYIHREDDFPTFTDGEEKATLDGGFAELILAPTRSRWYAIALYNLIDTDRPLLNVRLGGPAPVARYETLTGGVGYLWRRNFRVYGEATWDIEQRATRFGLGLTTAF